jgi:hypothetical protein
MSDEVKKVFLKNLKYAVIGVIVGALLSLATTTTYEKREFQVNLPSLLFSSATGFITGVLFSLLQAYEEVLSNHKKNLAACQIRYEDKVDSLDVLIKGHEQKFKDHEDKLIESYEILERIKDSLAHYGTIKNLLGSNEADRELIKSFLDQVINKPDYITRSSIIDFYKLLILGLQKCNVWRGIHQGSIRNLGFVPLDDTGESYFEILRNNQIKDKKRIIILTQDEQKDLKCKDVMEAFWEKTGKDVPSYWISRENFYKLTKLSTDVEVHDCALHNSKVLLHYHRNYHRTSNDPNISEGLIMIDYVGSKSTFWRAVARIFVELEKEKASRLLPFTEITKAYIDGLPNN